MSWRLFWGFAGATSRWNSKFISWIESYISDRSLTTLTWNTVHLASENYELFLSRRTATFVQATYVG